MLSPYMLFWQTYEEAEESIVNNKLKEMGFRKPMISNREIKLVKVDVALGMAFAVFCYVVNHGNDRRQSSCS